MPVKQILLVDDSLPWQRFVREILESEADLKIIATATDGSEAIQKARELRPDVILMDISLPGLNGFEATRQIRTLSPASKILLLSEHSSTDLIEAALQVGGSGYVWKSNCRSHLLTAIRVILRDQQFVSRSLRNLRRSEIERMGTLFEWVGQGEVFGSDDAKEESFRRA